MHPVFFGSAITGAGVDALTAGIRELLPAGRGDADGAGRRARSSRSSAVRPARRSPTSGCSPARCESGTGCRFRAGARGPRSPRSASSSRRRGRRPRRRSRAGQIAQVWGPRRRPDRRRDGRALAAERPVVPNPAYFAPPTLETVVVPDGAARHRATARRADPARRAGPADQPAAGRRPPGDLRVALRRGAEGGHPGDAGRRVRHRGRPSARRRRSASSGSTARGAAVELIDEATRTRSSPPSACGVDPAPVDAGVELPSWRSSSARCRTPSSRPSRRPCARRCARASTAGRSPTARSR